MDGNRRWARAQGLSLLDGHKHGYSKLKDVLDWCDEAGIQVVYAYAFSTENWKRSQEEVKYMMELLKNGLFKEEAEFLKRNVRFKAIGRLGDFSEDIQQGIRKLEEATAGGKKTLALCLSYGGRAEIIDMVKNIKGEITEESIAENLWTAGLPDPEMIIRTGGEMRLSNFLPWQGIYAELFFTKTLWPEFSKQEFESMIAEFNTRQRRHGA